MLLFGGRGGSKNLTIREMLLSPSSRLPLAVILLNHACYCQRVILNPWVHFQIPSSLLLADFDISSHPPSLSTTFSQKNFFVCFLVFVIPSSVFLFLFNWLLPPLHRFDFVWPKKDHYCIALHQSDKITQL